MKEDKGETTNLAEKNPRKVAELKAKLAQFNSEIIPPRWESILEIPVNIDKIDAQGWEKGDEYIYYPN